MAEKIETIGVAEAKRHFSELLDRVRRGERFVVSRHGRPEAALVPADEIPEAHEGLPLGLAAGAGALADWLNEEIDDMVREIYEARRRARDRPAPDLG